MVKESRKVTRFGTYGEPQSVSAIMAGDKDLAKPKSATFRTGTPKGCPLSKSDCDAGFSKRF